MLESLITHLMFYLYIIKTLPQLLLFLKPFRILISTTYFLLFRTEKLLKEVFGFISIPILIVVSKFRTYFGGILQPLISIFSLVILVIITYIVSKDKSNDDFNRQQLLKSQEAYDVLPDKRRN